MSISEKIGYITIIYWGYKLLRDVTRRVFTCLFTHQEPIDLYTLGKWGIVTGCSHGIGRAYAQALAKMGLNLVLISFDAEKLESMAADIERMYNIKAKVITLNFTEGMQTYRNVEKEIVGLEISILVNNLSMSYPHPEYFLDLPRREKIYMNIIHYNVVVMTNMCRVVLPLMLEKEKGVVVNVASSVAILPSPLLTVFAATKAYVLKFSRDLQIEYGKCGIIVQCLLPGPLTCHTSQSPKNSWMTPTPDRYVHSAIQTIGKEGITTGFFPHSLLIGIVKLIYRVSPSLVYAWMIKAMERNRINALRRYVG